MPDDSKRELPKALAPPPVFFVAGLVVAIALDYAAPWGLPGGRARQVIGIIWIVASLALVAWTLRAFVQHRTSVNLYRETQALITTGPFAFTRNPIYVSLAMLYVGVGLMASSVWMLVLAIPALALTHWTVVLPEERYLASRFGADYREYCARVRRWL